MRTYRSIMTFLCLAEWISLSAQGLKLFSPEIHDAASYPHQVVMDFLERYFGKDIPSERETTLEFKMVDDKVFFRKGKYSDLRQVNDTMPCSITFLDRYYEVKWAKDSIEMAEDVPFVTVVFPAQYDLLLGTPKDEAQNSLKEKILSAPKFFVEKECPIEMEQIEDGIFRSKKEYFELESLDDATYYNKESGEYHPVFDSAHLEYSAANLFHGLVVDVDYRMYVEQSVYGMKTVNYTISLQQWLNYCAQLGMKVYFAVEEQREDGILAIVLVQCRELGFNHLLSVVFPDKFIADQNAVLKVRMKPYIPTHNVKDLYKQETVNHKKKIWK